MLCESHDSIRVLKSQTSLFLVWNNFQYCSTSQKRQSCVEKRQTLSCIHEKYILIKMYAP